MNVGLPYLSFDAATRRLRLDPHEPRFFDNPYEAYAWLHARGDVFFWEEFGHWFFGGYDDVSRLLRDRRFGRQNPAGIPDSRGIGEDRSHLAAFDAVEANSMLELEPPVHTRLRTLVNRAFVSRQVERLRPRVEALANELVDRFEPGQPVDLLPAFAAPLPITIIAEMLGVPVGMGPQLLDWSHEMVAMYMHGRTRETEDRANTRRPGIFRFPARLTPPSAAKIPATIFCHCCFPPRKTARNSTKTNSSLRPSSCSMPAMRRRSTRPATRSALCWHKAAIPRRFFATQETTAATVEECLRYDAPLHMFTRYAYEEMELADGIVVKAGEQVGLLLGMANRDPKSLCRHWQV